MPLPNQEENANERMQRRSRANKNGEVVQDIVEELYITVFSMD